MTEAINGYHPHSNFRFARWSREDDATLQAGYAERRSARAIARELGRTIAAVQVRASTYGLARKQAASKQQHSPSPQPLQHNWRDLTLLVTVGQRWGSYPKDTQDAFLERIGPVRR